MKRFACFVIALFATIWALRAQQTIVTYTPDGVKTYDTAEPPSELLDTTQFVVSYRMLYRQRPENEHPMEDLLLLQIGRNVTKFYSYKTWQTDSLVRVTPPEQVMANLGSFHGGVQDVLFRDAAAGRLTHTDQIGMDHLLYTEPLPDCGWELTDGERTILGYACRRAACTFRGRNYEAWYTPEIAVSCGPWKFGGLPGLILAVRDAAGVLELEATGVEQRVEPICMTDRNYMKTNRKKYLELKQKVMTDPVGYLAGNSNVRMTIKSEDGTPLNPGDLLRGYNAIELE
ncbi:MAG TPA: GLPGLI family protein [Candidatus Alistipes cottocaccae]|nr:GLPGLI family protein [Candidatus Alistipes cottocaccae]